MTGTVSNAGLQVEQSSASALLISVSGDWREKLPSRGVARVKRALDEGPSIRFLNFETRELTGWDTRFVAFVGECASVASKRRIRVRDEGLPEGVRRLLHLAESVPEREARPKLVRPNWLQGVGERTVRGWGGLVTLFTFLGENLAALGKLLRGKAQFRWSDAFLVMEQTGPAALGIVVMINFLMGLILAFVGALELRRFGASIYVADLVGIASVRELSPIMTAVILSGRTGAAFAAQLGTMKVNEEINALQTFGISPIEFLVLPRMVALMLMMPFLCVFADLISILGGFVVSSSISDVAPIVYVDRTIAAIHLKTFLIGIVKGSFFGFLVAYTGCLRGMQSGYSAAAVGQATTQAVVLGISAIIAFDGVFAVICNALNI